MLDPTTINRGSTIETQPYHHRTANEMDIGGGTKYRNDVLLDGTPLTAGNKLGYTPPMDAVTEYTVQQNSVDAEFGHSAGGIAIVTMKSGTNEVNGSAYYYGRDAEPERDDRPGTCSRHNDNPYWNAGATIGLPIKKNKLFVFAVFEKIENTQSQAGQLHAADRARAPGRLLAVLQRRRHAARDLRPADLAHRSNGEHGPRPVPGQQDPREPLGPAGRADPGGLWMPNNAGDDRTGFNNFKYQDELNFHYYNFSTRLDWNISDSWKTFARVSRMKTDQDADDYTDGKDPLKMRNITGQQAQRLEHRRRHRLHLQPLDDAQRARLLLPGRGQARLPGHGGRRGGLRRTCGRTAGGSRTSRDGRSSTSPTSSWTAPPARQFGVAELLVPAAQGLQRPRARSTST